MNFPSAAVELNTLIARLEEGHLYYEGHTGSWLSETGVDYLSGVFDEEVRPGLEMELEELSEKGVYLITINNPYWASDGGYWDMNYGYVAPESHLEWEGPVAIERQCCDGTRCHSDVRTCNVCQEA